MKARIRSILQAVAEYKQTQPGFGMELRLSLSELVLRNMRRKQWNQRQLAERAGVKESFLSRVLHSDTNCTLDTAGKLLWALGVRARFEEVAATSAEVPLRAMTGTTNILKLVIQGTTDGQTIATTQEATDSTTDSVTRIRCATY